MHTYNYTERNEEDNVIAVKYHDHGGYYNDGNSEYWVNDYRLDLAAGTVTATKETTAGGQMARNGHYQDDVTTATRAAIPLSEAQQQAVYDTLSPLTETRRKYPNCASFRFFSDKHRRLIFGRIAKAAELCGDSDYHGINCLVHLFVLPAFGLVVCAHAEYSRGHQFFDCELIPLTAPGGQA